MTGARRSRRYLAVLAVALSVLVGVAGAGLQSAADAKPRRVLSVSCGNIIGSTRAAAVAGGRVMLDGFAAPPSRLERAARSGNASWPYFAKYGVEIRAGVGPVTLSIPPPERAEAAISWGNGLPVDAVVRFASCSPSPQRWNAYAGGFFTRSPTACVNLLVTIGSRSATARFGIGRRCVDRSTARPR